MSKQSRMLECIRGYLEQLMTTNTVKLIPYDKLTENDFYRAKLSFANDAEFEDVVCLLSTSVFETGKTGVLFTTKCMYCKAWGPFTGSYKNWLIESATAGFGLVNEFDQDQMRKLMNDLAVIALEEGRNERAQRSGMTVDGSSAGVMGIIEAGAMISQCIKDNRKKSNQDATNQDVIASSEQLTTDSPGDVWDALEDVAASTSKLLKMLGL